ncbi:hypothetical protein FACS1894103_1810 [Campylobacterota bacterium]|nr:hypothetical protein FACS1894103_1810 [Campylobacterota bacterium]
MGLKEGRKNELINLAFACGMALIMLHWYNDPIYASIFAVASALLLYVSCLPSRESKAALNFALRKEPVQKSAKESAKDPAQKFDIPTELKPANKAAKTKFQPLAFSLHSKPKRPKFSLSLNAIAEPFKQQAYEPIVAHLGCRYDTVFGKVTVVLSSAYYWYRHSTVSFASPRAARKFAPSVFYSWIPEGNYKYFVFKEADGYGFIACDTNEVRNRLAEQGLDIYLVQRIYFAQSALDSSLSPLMITSDLALTHISGAWVVLPTDGTEFSGSQMVINPHSPSFRLKQEVSVGGKMSRKRFAFAAALLGIMFVSQLLDFWRISTAISEIENAKEELLLRNKLPPTMMQLDSIEKRLTLIAASQYGLRDNLSRLLVQVQNGHIQMLAYSDSSIKAQVKANSPEAAITLGAAISKLPKTDAVVANDEITVDVRW